MSDKKIAYTVESSPDYTQFFNSAGQLIWATGGKCIAYTQNSATMVWCGRRDVYRFDLNGTPNLIRSDNI
ncbi:MAG: hypothetical protein RL494_839 [Bacteroidota bacterium]|jgi:hypothetical protein